MRGIPPGIVFLRICYSVNLRVRTKSKRSCALPHPKKRRSMKDSPEEEIKIKGGGGDRSKRFVKKGEI